MSGIFRQDAIIQPFNTTEVIYDKYRHDKFEKSLIHT